MILFLEARPILHLATSNLISNNCPHVQSLKEETACDPYKEVEMVGDETGGDKRELQPERLTIRDFS